MAHSSHTEWHQCVCCGQQFESLSEMMRHMTHKHSEEEVLIAIAQYEKSNGSYPYQAHNDDQYSYSQ